MTAAVAQYLQDSMAEATLHAFDFLNVMIYSSYSDILAADPSAWSKDQTQVGGNTVHYTGVASMKKLATYSRGFGGTMFWELSQDGGDPQASLYGAIQATM